VHVIETVGGVLIWMSAIAFILLGVMVGVRRNLATNFHLLGFGN